MVVVQFVLVLVYISSRVDDVSSQCPSLPFGVIPSSHLFNKLTKPIIIGHRGQPKVYQENTLDGILSTSDVGADGFELDIFITKDDKLVVFHDNNLKALTGADKYIWDCTYDELASLEITTTIEKGGKTYKYDKPRKIPLLEKVLNATLSTNLLHLLEMKPSTVPSTDQQQVNRGKKLTELLADMITRLGLVNRALVFSFDHLKVLSMKQRNPEIVVGSLFPRSVSKADASTIAKVKQQISVNMPLLKPCMSTLSDNGTEFAEFLLKNGTVYKAMNSTFVVTSIEIFDSNVGPKNTIRTLKSNYGNDTTIGLYTAYSMGYTDAQNHAYESKLIDLTSQGLSMVITDDIPRSRKLLRGIESDGSSVKEVSNVVVCACLIVAVMNAQHLRM